MFFFDGWVFNFVMYGVDSAYVASCVGGGGHGCSGGSYCALSLFVCFSVMNCAIYVRVGSPVGVGWEADLVSAG